MVENVLFYNGDKEISIYVVSMLCDGDEEVVAS